MTPTPPTSARARVIAFYLPQFHPIPENDHWWGAGFTEWTNVAKAKPLFRDHYQPRVPADLGFYDLRVPETRLAQAEMAQAHGIEAFCYWHYWFAGDRLLERPFNEVLHSGEPNFPFCLGWANDSWTGIWHGAPGRILKEQTYPGMDDHQAHFYALLGAFQDDRYVRVEGKPLFVIYRPQKLPDAKRVIDFWKELAVKEGLAGLHLVGVTQNETWNPREYGFDAMTVSNQTKLRQVRSPSLLRWLYRRLLRTSFMSAVYKRVLRRPVHVYEYEEALPHFLARGIKHEYYPSVIPNWDNTPRSGANGFVLHNSTPALFRRQLKAAIEIVSPLPRERQIIFVKSWNEWAEGNHLEPDLRDGEAYLQIVRDEVNKTPR